MSSRMWTVTFLRVNDGPVSLTSLRLKVSPARSRKNTRKITIVAWVMKVTSPIEPASTQSITLKLLLRAGCRRRLARRGALAFHADAGGGLLDLGGGRLHLLDRARLPAGRLGQRPRQLLGDLRQVVDDVEELVLHPVDHQAHQADDGERDQGGADGALDVPALEPQHDRVEGVGDEDAEQKRHQEFLRPLQRVDESDGGDDAQRQPARVDVDREAQSGVAGGVGRIWSGRGDVIHDDSVGGGCRARVC